MRKSKTKEIEKLEVIDLPRGRKELWENLNTGAINMNSIIGDFPRFGIFTGDKVIYQITDKFFENVLMGFQVIGNNRVGLGYYFDNFGDVGFNQVDTTVHFKRSKVKPVGIVIGVIKPFTHRPFGEIFGGEKTELVLACAECGKEATGDKKILLASGWENYGDSWLCLNCDLKND